MDYLPSKQFRKNLIILASFGVVIIIVAFIAGGKIKFSTNQNDNSKVILVKDAVEKDTDGDGLKDWEEALWRTNPQVIDTDGDGLSDFQNVKNNQSKLSSAASGGDLKNDDLSITNTEQLARDIVTTLASLQQSGSLNSQSTETLINEIGKFISSKPPQKIYTGSDIKIEEYSKTKKQAYLIYLDGIFKKYPVKGEDLTLAYRIPELINTTEGVKELEGLSTKYKNISDQMLKTIVPMGSEKSHLMVINATSHLSSIYNDMTKYKIDPIVTLSAVAQFDSVIEEVNNAFEEFQRMIYNP